MLQTIALAITRSLCFAFEDLPERYIRLVLEEFALVGNPAEQVKGDLDVLIQDLELPIAEECLVDQSRKHRIIVKLF
jgi:hypothetical protein